jgi:hypothetical protein
MQNSKALNMPRRYARGAGKASRENLRLVQLPQPGTGGSSFSAVQMLQFVKDNFVVVSATFPHFF